MCTLKILPMYISFKGFIQDKNDFIFATLTYPHQDAMKMAISVLTRQC
jgi:hypothetical protein